MLSKEAEKKLQRLVTLIAQVQEIHAEIESLLMPASEQQPESPTEDPSTKRKGRPRKERIVPKFTDAQIEKMVRESDEGKSAREIMHEYGFKSTGDWYLLKSKWKKQHATANLPDFNADDDEEEPEDEPVVERPAETARVAKRYDYQCSCGYSFKSTIPPTIIKCPDCMGKPKVVEEQPREEP
jgi:hypothetical protein